MPARWPWSVEANHDHARSLQLPSKPSVSPASGSLIRAGPGARPKTLKHDIHPESKGVLLRLSDTVEASVGVQHGQAPSLTRTLQNFLVNSKSPRCPLQERCMRDFASCTVWHSDLFGGHHGIEHLFWTSHSRISVFLTLLRFPPLNEKLCVRPAS